ncbi:MAG TPA: Gldg family protein [Mucilaginibacter sp.]|nr:Gldg family protein [Mucilaginibacter sp.]
MKTIIRIIYIELKTLFASPIGWIVIILFSLQAGNEFVSHISREIYSAASGGHLINQTAFTIARYDTRFNEERGVFAEMQRYLFLYMPLLTMGAISREISSGTFKLLQSSPIAKWQITIGKFAALAIFGLLVLSLLLIGFLMDSYCVTGLDYSLFWSGLLGLWLLICTYAAIGLFISACSQNQPVAALLTFIVLFALSYNGTWGRQYGVIRACEEYFNLAKRSDNMLNGLIRLGDTVYLLAISALFLTLSKFKLQATTNKLGKTEWANTILFALLLLTLLIGSQSEVLLSVRADVNKYKTQSLTSESERIVRQIHGPLQVHAYVNIVGPTANLAFPAYRSADFKVFDQFRNSIPGIKQDLTMYYDTCDNNFLFKDFPGNTVRQVAMKNAYKNGIDFNQVLSPVEARKRVDYRNEEGRLFRVLEYQGKKVRLQTFDTFPYLEQPQEEDIVTALKQLITPESKIIFLTGNGERKINSKADSDIYYAAYASGERDALRNKGFEVGTLDLNTGEIPDNLCALVLADPKIAFNANTIIKLQNYVKEGGNLVVMGEASSQNPLNPILNSLGISLQGQLYQTDQEYLPDQIGAEFTDQAIKVDTAFRESILNYPGLSFHVDSAVVSMAGAAALQINAGKGFKYVPVLVTNHMDTYFRPAPDADIMLKGKFTPAAREKREPKILAVALSRNIKGRQQRIMVIGDADWLTKKEIERRGNKSANVNFYTGIFNWMSYGAYPVFELRKNELNRLRITKPGLPWLQIFYFGLLPGTLLIIGTITLYKRKMT